MESIPPSPVFPGTRWALVLTSGLLGLLGCSGAVLGDGSDTADGGTQGASPRLEVADGGPAGAACEHYYAAQYTRCGGPILPPSEAARVEARFVQACVNDIALPGSGMTTVSVAGVRLGARCFALRVSGRPAASVQLSRIVALWSARPMQGSQRQSGHCQGTAFFSPEGPIGPTTCGTCGSWLASARFAPMAISRLAARVMPYASLVPAWRRRPNRRTRAWRLRKEMSERRATTFRPSAGTGLYCAAQTGTCSMLADAGARCGDGAKLPGGCVAPLACVGTPGACASGGVGSPCTHDSDCAPGFGCAQAEHCTSTGSGSFCSSSGTCSAITWAAQGQVCDGGGGRAAS